ncbi:cytochrome P450 monooxygenase [Fomitopsis serialis]|uniref:cytochrome P450 monooxygenase n=1 Tax=Fomitopsis serialis TaxID=139415 RepID=UPI0020079B95|nr:cytochrome P450 monooxygenase [Neoantrodia serialis]KAH9930145.1 cytochrome P450 monooxygenase [Neoantrodia serialis]
MEPLILLASLIIAAACFLAIHGRTSAKLRLPPGPTRLPLLGNVHQLPSMGHQRTFAEWGERYGDVIYARLFRTPAIVVNSMTAAQELLDKRSAKYSHRPRFILLQELMGWDVMTHFSYGERWRRHRKWIAGAFQDKDALLSYRPLQRRETYTLLSGLMDTPHLFMGHIRRYPAAMIMEIAYGHCVESSDDKYIHLAERASTVTLESGDAGAMLVDFFPSCTCICPDVLPAWAPGAGFKKKASAAKKVIQELLDTPYEMVKSAMMKGVARPCFTTSLLEEIIQKGTLKKQDEHEIKGAAGLLYGGDSTTAVLATFMLAMKARTEIDRVVGTERLPDFDDRPSLLYLECVIREVLRWNSPVPLGSLRGFDIPANAMVIPNIWAMNNDVNLYSTPSAFQPERFMEMDPQTLASRDPRNVVFGFGRRVCPGQEFADSSVWLAAACIIAAVDVNQALDKSGKCIVPPAAFDEVFVSHPKEFLCDIKPRSQKAKRTVADFLTNHTM